MEPARHCREMKNTFCLKSRNFCSLIASINLQFYIAQIQSISFLLFQSQQGTSQYKYIIYVRYNFTDSLSDARSSVTLGRNAARRIVSLDPAEVSNKPTMPSPSPIVICQQFHPRINCLINDIMLQMWVCLIHCIATNFCSSQ